MRQMPKIPDILLSGNPTPANDNCLPSIMNMKDYEAESILAQRYCTRRSKRNRLGPIAVLCAGAIAVFVLKLAGAI
jgi:hypothetical protein